MQLDGSTSYDPDGDPLTYAWSLQKPPGSIALLSNSTVQKPTFVADVHGDYLASLVVRDSFGAQSAVDTVLLNFSNVPPVADAGDNQTVVTGVTVHLNGSRSTDANFDTLTYSWTLVSKPNNSAAMLDNPAATRPSFVADLAGMYIASLVVNDGFVMSNPSNATITATVTQLQAIEVLREAISTINGLNPSVFKNPNMQNTLTNKINAAILDLDQGLYQQALDQLQNDILAKTDGCARTTMPDKNDWITYCATQAEVYPLIAEAIDLVKRLL